MRIREIPLTNAAPKRQRSSAGLSEGLIEGLIDTRITRRQCRGETERRRAASCAAHQAAFSHFSLLFLHGPASFTFNDEENP